MDNRELEQSVALYKRILLVALGQSYQIHDRNFKELIDIEQGVAFTTMPAGAFIVQIKYRLAQALMKLGKSVSFKHHQQALTILSHQSKQAKSSADLILIIRKASVLLFPIKAES